MIRFRPPLQDFCQLSPPCALPSREGGKEINEDFIIEIGLAGLGRLEKKLISGGGKGVMKLEKEKS